VSTAAQSGSTRTDEVHHRLRADILAGRLHPGQRLKFPDLCQRYGSSVGVTREALTRLAAEGLVRTQTHQGYQVTPISHEDLAELTTARVEIESLVFRRAVTAGDMAWEAAAVAAHHVLERTSLTAAEDDHQVTDDWVVAHAAFHNALLAGCDNRRLLATARSLRDEAELYRRWSVSLGHEPDRDLPGEHRHLLDVALTRDADLAANRLRDHIAHTTQLLLTGADDEPTPTNHDEPADH
jgi:DNA-binding GntR family transcriptional regulator